MKSFKIKIVLVTIILCCFSKAFADNDAIKIGFISYMSGPASTDYGLPAKHAAEAIIKSINEGNAPTPYSMKGFSGTQIELIFLDEAGGATKQVTEFTQLVMRHKVDFVIGYLSSTNCLAVAPVAEKLKILTILLDCGTARIFEENDFKYVFRTRAHSTMDVIAAAKYLLTDHPEIKNFSGINPNYAYGQESWRDWNAVMSILAPRAEQLSSQMPKLHAGLYGSEISSLARKKSDVIYSSLWGGDLKAFLMQAYPRELFKETKLILVAGEPNLQNLAGFIPDGTIVTSRGMTSGMMENDSKLNRWLIEIFQEKSGGLATYPVYSTANAILGLKKAYEKARLTKLQKAVPMADVAGVQDGMRQAYLPPNTKQIIAAFEGLGFETPNGRVEMALGKGHQAIHGTSFGTTRTKNGKVYTENVKFFPAKEVQPPKNIKSLDWILNGFQLTK